MLFPWKVVIYDFIYFINQLVTLLKKYRTITLATLQMVCLWCTYAVHSRQGFAENIGYYMQALVTKAHFQIASFCRQQHQSRRLIKSHKTVSRECLTGLSHGNVSRDCLTKLSHGIVSRHGLTGLSHGNVSRECLTGLSHGIVSQDCLTARSHGTVSRHGLTRMCHRTVSQDCLTGFSLRTVSRDCLTGLLF